jgi:hypothetical protein
MAGKLNAMFLQLVGDVKVEGDFISIGFEGGRKESRSTTHSSCILFSTYPVMLPHAMGPVI